MMIQIINIISSSILSLIAIIISIISINKQTKSQNINSTIALFDKRFDIYNFVIELWYIVGYFEGGQDLKQTPKHTYQEIISLINHIELSSEIRDKIKTAYIKSNKYSSMTKCLFSGEIEEYLTKLISSFSIYINGIYHNKSIDPQREEHAYKQIIKLHETENIDIDKLRQFIDLSDIKRLDI